MLTAMFFPPFLLLLLFWPIFGNFRCLVATFETISSYHSNFKKILRSQKNPKNYILNKFRLSKAIRNFIYIFKINNQKSTIIMIALKHVMYLSVLRLLVSFVGRPLTSCPLSWTGPGACLECFIARIL